MVTMSVLNWVRVVTNIKAIIDLTNWGFSKGLVEGLIMKILEALYKTK